jgi:hypothetical protein
MKLTEIVQRKPGFPLVPGGKATYVLNKASSVEFTGGEPLPKDDEQSNWHFFDGDFDVVVPGKFKESVKKAIKDHMRAKGSSFSHTLKVSR